MPINTKTSPDSWTEASGKDYYAQTREYIKDYIPETRTETATNSATNPLTPTLTGFKPRHAVLTLLLGVMFGSRGVRQQSSSKANRPPKNSTSKSIGSKLQRWRL